MARRGIVTAGAAALAAAAAATGIWALADYRAWRALGSGGVPPTWRAWAATRTRAAPRRRPESDDAVPPPGEDS